MANQVVFAALIALCLTNGYAYGAASSSPPARYTITHEATFEVIVKENIQATEIMARGKIVIGLFGDIVPMTVLNFVTIANGVVRDGVSFETLIRYFSYNFEFILDELHL